MDNSDTIVDKVLINLVNNEFDNLKEMQTFIRDFFGEDYKFTIDEAISKIEYMKENDKTTNTLMQTVLFFSIIVSLFGLVSSMYSTLIERMFEIGIIRAMGMRPYEVRTLLIAEAVTIMLAAGSLGMFIGILIAYLLQTNVALITEMPVIVTVNYLTLASTFLVSLGVSIIGMILITTKVRRWSIMEILRTTF
jgi:putative ABC transport system permease protein